MHHADAGALAGERAADVHQARRVGRGADLGARVQDVADLVGEHRHRRVGVLDRERPAEAAALARAVELDEVDPADVAQQPLGVGDRPARLLRAVRGIDLVELEDALECCGFGGTFAVKNADTSMALLGDKLGRGLQTRAEVCTAVDTSCLMHIGGGLRRQRAGVRTMHIAEILAAEE